MSGLLSCFTWLAHQTVHVLSSYFVSRTSWLCAHNLKMWKGKQLPSKTGRTTEFKTPLGLLLWDWAPQIRNLLSWKAGHFTEESMLLPKLRCSCYPKVTCLKYSDLAFENCQGHGNICANVCVVHSIPNYLFVCLFWEVLVCQRLGDKCSATVSGTDCRDHCRTMTLEKKKRERMG